MIKDRTVPINDFVDLQFYIESVHKTAELNRSKYIAFRIDHTEDKKLKVYEYVLDDFQQARELTKKNFVVIGKEFLDIK